MFICLSINQSNFIMKCDKRTQNIESSVRMTVQCMYVCMRAMAGRTAGPIKTKLGILMLTQGVF